MGKDAGWSTQTREGETLSYKDAFRAHRWEINTGLLFASMLILAPQLTLWFAPIILPLIASPFIAVATSRKDLGALAGRLGLLVTPEEVTERSEALGAQIHQLFPVVSDRHATVMDLDLPETSVFWPNLIATQRRAMPASATVH